MIGKAAVAGGAVVPVVWTILGYPFEAASMITGQTLHVNGGMAMY